MKIFKAKIHKLLQNIDISITFTKFFTVNN